MRTVILVGAGRMGSAMLYGWLKNLETPTQFLVLDPHTKPSFDEMPEDIFAGHKYQHFDTASKIPEYTNADAVLLATKPQMVVDSVISVQGLLGSNSVLVSVAADVSTDTIQGAVLGNPAVIRIMPNIGAMVGYAVSAGFASENTTASQKALVASLFSSIGVFSWLDREDDLHAVTALSGSGPAYYFALCEAMIEAAQTLGLPDETSRNLAIGTVVAAGRLLEQTANPEYLRNTVTSPNGTTAAGLDVMTDSGALSDLVRATLSAARDRSVELA